ncbi:hypothetical protein [Nesterenkonia muleiensis]|uniref:hypothetical protein n=1 Tax=Nesterenkonia muleiensis TaxID=2282648 RepID=UPI00130044DD|nr:hypothetical protein [Nesterenkonia muleiensis]
MKTAAQSLDMNNEDIRHGSGTDLFQFWVPVLHQLLKDREARRGVLWSPVQQRL